MGGQGVMLSETTAKELLNGCQSINSWVQLLSTAENRGWVGEGVPSEYVRIKNQPSVLLIHYIATLLGF